MIKAMNSKMTTDSQLSTVVTRTETESQKWRSHGGLSAGEGEGRKGTGNK